jgi:hypothetical protein
VKLADLAEQEWKRAVPADRSTFSAKPKRFEVLIEDTGKRVNRTTWAEWFRLGWLGRIEDGLYLVMREDAETAGGPQ